jgi:hypothetical protein
MDVGIEELKGWLGIKINMRVKLLPCQQDYWFKLEEVLNG